MRSIRPLAVALLTLAGCGDDAPGNPDAPDMIDAAPDAPSMPGGCDYTELQDATNDDLNGGTPETTAESLGSTVASKVTLCGQVDSTHFVAADGLVDVDGFAVTLPGGPVRVTVSGPGLETLEDVTLEISEGMDFVDLTDRQFFKGTHVFYMADLPPKLYQFAIQTGNASAITAAIPYKIVITVDDPATRCPKITAAANHTEGTDTGATSNDVIDRDFSPVGGMPIETLSTAPTDMPEVTTNGTINPGPGYRISATLTDAVIVGDYKDRDTFAFTTGPSTDEVSIRVNWAGMADLDMFVYEGALPSFANSYEPATMEGEFKTMAVKPSTTYWVWTGLYRMSTGPKPYDVSICGADFTHP